jgi:branched-chain amino acid transport system ATP-binding protein
VPAVPSVAMALGEPVLRVRDLEVVYGGAALVLRGVNLEVPRGGVVAVLGPNGAGKTTLLRAVTGLLGIHRGEITRGTIELDGERIDHASAPAIVRRGVAQVMEGRRTFADLTVEENLRAGGYVEGRATTRTRMGQVYELFPVLAGRRQSVAGYLSGGEQQMLAIGRALMQSPRLLLLDEPSLGLAPQVAAKVGEVVRQLNGNGTSIVLVEQNATMALSVASEASILESGRVAKSGLAAELLDDPEVRNLYLGITSAGGQRRSLRGLPPRARVRQVL